MISTWVQSGGVSGHPAVMLACCLWYNFGFRIGLVGAVVLDTSVSGGYPLLNRPHLNSQQRAWLVLLTAFTLFCTFCAVSGYGVHWFLFQSTVPLQAVVAVGRGTVGYIGADQQSSYLREERRIMSVNENVSTDGQSQATILYLNNASERVLIASVTLKGNTSLDMGHATYPRFDWSQLAYRVDLTDVQGELEVYVPPNLDRDFLLTVETAQNLFVYLMASGTYTVNTSTTQIQVDNHGGVALLITPDLQPHDVPAGQRGTISTAEDNTLVFALTPGPLDLLQDSRIQSLSPSEIRASDGLVADLVQPWLCGSTQEGDPPGIYNVGFPDGRAAVHMLRTGGASTHGETSCSLTPGPGQSGRDVSQFSYLRLKAIFRIEGHSLSACGNLGSECPVMVQIDYLYRDELGNEQPDIFYHGFYTDFDPLQDLPKRCSSCLLDHEQIYPNKWYVYDSGNLFALLPENRRPVSILRVKFYASGHEYDIYMSDVALHAG